MFILPNIYFTKLYSTLNRKIGETRVLKKLKRDNACIIKKNQFLSLTENRVQKPICFQAPSPFFSIISFDLVTRNVNFRILEFQSCSTGVEFEQYYSLVADDDDDDNVFLTMGHYRL